METQTVTERESQTTIVQKKIKLKIDDRINGLSNGGMCSALTNFYGALLVASGHEFAKKWSELADIEAKRSHWYDVSDELIQKALAIIERARVADTPQFTVDLDLKPSRWNVFTSLFNSQSAQMSLGSYYGTLPTPHDREVPPVSYKYSKIETIAGKYTTIPKVSYVKSRYEVPNREVFCPVTVSHLRTLHGILTAIRKSFEESNLSADEKKSWLIAIPVLRNYIGNVPIVDGQKQKQRTEIEVNAEQHLSLIVMAPGILSYFDSNIGSFAYIPSEQEPRTPEMDLLEDIENPPKNVCVETHFFLFFSQRK